VVQPLASSNCATVNGLRIYCEIRGPAASPNAPLILLQGGAGGALQATIRDPELVLRLVVVSIPERIAPELRRPCIRRRAVDRRDLATHRPNVRGELAPMVNRVEVDVPEKLPHGLLGDHLPPVEELRDGVPPFIVDRGEDVGQLLIPSFKDR
jgi:hypothetical protein